MKKKILFIITLVMLLITLCPISAEAAENDWVLDNCDVMTKETMDYIADLNENVYPDYVNKPQYAVIVIDKLPAGYTMDEYKLEMFNEYGVGTKKENCGVLFVIAISDRKYGLEIGEGFERGSLIRKDLETDFIGSELKNLLRAEKYDEVILEVTKKVETILLNQENGTYAQKQAEYDKTEEEVARVAGIVFCVTIIGVILAFAGYWLIKLFTALGRRSRLLKTVDEYSSLIKYTGCSEEQVKDGIKKYWTRDIAYGGIERFVIELLYDAFILELKQNIKKERLAWDKQRYFYNAENLNSVSEFKKGNIIDATEIIKITNQEEQKRYDVSQANKRLIADYVAKNEEKIDKTLKVTADDIAEKIYDKIVSDFNHVNETQVETAFNDIIRSLEFDREYEKFLELTKDKITPKYFDKNDFKREILRSKEYRENYHGGHITNYIWMIALLNAHMDTQERAYKRRHSSSYRPSSSHSSFGSSFGGGFSRGGGFSGGW